MPYLKINQDDAKPPFEELVLPDEPRAWLDACHNALGCSIIETAPTVFCGIVLVIDGENLVPLTPDDADQVRRHFS